MATHLNGVYTIASNKWQQHQAWWARQIVYAKVTQLSLM